MEREKKINYYIAFLRIIGSFLLSNPPLLLYQGDCSLCGEFRNQSQHNQCYTRLPLLGCTRGASGHLPGDTFEYYAKFWAGGESHSPSTFQRAPTVKALKPDRGPSKPQGPRWASDPGERTGNQAPHEDRRLTKNPVGWIIDGEEPLEGG